MGNRTPVKCGDNQRSSALSLSWYRLIAFIIPMLGITKVGSWSFEPLNSLKIAGSITAIVQRLTIHTQHCCIRSHHVFAFRLCGDYRSHCWTNCKISKWSFLSRPSITLSERDRAGPLMEIPSNGFLYLQPFPWIYSCWRTIRKPVYIRFQSRRLTEEGSVWRKIYVQKIGWLLINIHTAFTKSLAFFQPA